MPLKFACSVVIVGPVENAVVVPARAAYSHSASVSSLYVLPVLRDSQGRYSFVMSSHDTLITGRLSRPQPSSSGLCLQPPTARHASQSANVTSCLPTAKTRSMVTVRCGPSSSERPCSRAGEPITKVPAGTTIISGQSGQSLNVSLGLRQRLSLPNDASRPSHCVGVTAIAASACLDLASAVGLK